MTTICQTQIPTTQAMGQLKSDDLLSRLAVTTTGAINWAIKGLKNAYALRAKRQIDRQAFSHLLALDNHILNDIGVTREDVIWASKLPLEANASCELEIIAKANRT